MGMLAQAVLPVDATMAVAKTAIGLATCSVTRRSANATREIASGTPAFMRQASAPTLADAILVAGEVVSTGGVRGCYS